MPGPDFDFCPWFGPDTLTPDTFLSFRDNDLSVVWDHLNFFDDWFLVFLEHSKMTNYYLIFIFKSNSI